MYLFLIQYLCIDENFVQALDWHNTYVVQFVEKDRYVPTEPNTKIQVFAYSNILANSGAIFVKSWCLR